MTAIAKLDRNRAKYAPSEAFAAPEEIFEAVLMTRGEKLAALQRWRREICHEMSASTDGMNTCGVSDLLIRRLHRIDETIDRLKV